MTASTPELERLQGSVERVTFHSEESGFCVLRLIVKGQRELVTLVGNAASITAGEYIESTGQWIVDKKHGLQFRAQQLKTVPPTTLAGIEKYLGSGMVKGIGPHFAKKLVKAFGETVFDVIEQTPRRLLELDGIGQKRMERVTTAWAEQRVIRSIMVFLQSYGLGTARAVRIYKTYGEQAVERVRENPYRLALDIRGIGFKTADNLAQALGIPNDSLIRAQAGVSHVLQTLCDQGHCAAEKSQLLKASQELLDIPAGLIESAIEAEVIEEHIVPETIQAQACYYPVSLYQAETRVAAKLKHLVTGQPPWGTIDLAKALPWVEAKTGLSLAESQRHAIETVLRAKVSIITGGPGVGKTTLVNSLIQILLARKVPLGLCAPTGRAAKRLSETTGLTAKTIHRLLDFDPKTFGFKHHQDNPLPINVLIIDEASVIDIVLMNHLLKAVSSTTAVIFVGDIDQLPSVGPGAVLANLIQSQLITTVRLTEVFRQAAHSHIILNAHRINQGQLPLPNAAQQGDFFTLYESTPEAIHQTVLEVVTQRLPTHYHCDPKQTIQVLTPMNRGGLGSRALNASLQTALNGRAEPKLQRFGSLFSPGDKVIQMTNNYDKEVFNGGELAVSMCEPISWIR